MRNLVKYCAAQRSQPLIRTRDIRGTAKGKHAAIYLRHDAVRMLVLDQWNDQGEVKERPIAFKRPNGTRRSNDGDTFYVIE